MAGAGAEKSRPRCSQGRKRWGDQADPAAFFLVLILALAPAAGCDPGFEEQRSVRSTLPVSSPPASVSSPPPASVDDVSSASLPEMDRPSENAPEAEAVESKPTPAEDTPNALARLDGSPFLPAEFRVFLDRVRSKGYRPVSRAEAQRLLREALREKALDVETERRGRSLDDPANRDQTYRDLTIELTGSAPIGSPDVGAGSPDRGTAGYARRLSRVQSKHRARIQRRVILETLLDRSAIEVDADKLEAFLDPGVESPESPRPPIAGASEGDPEKKAAS